MYSELNYQNPVTDVHYHPRDHMVAFCSLGENHPVLIYSYDPASEYKTFVLFLIWFSLFNLTLS